MSPVGRRGPPPEGELVLLDEQDRTQWNQQLIAEGVSLVERSMRSRQFGTFTLQAATAAVHGEAGSADSTDWTEIVGLYCVLLRVDASPVGGLKRPAPMAMRDGPAAG